MNPLGFHGISLAIMKVAFLRFNHDLISGILLVKGDRFPPLASALLLYEVVHQHVEWLVYCRLLPGEQKHSLLWVLLDEHRLAVEIDEQGFLDGVPLWRLCGHGLHSARSAVCS